MSHPPSVLSSWSQDETQDEQPTQDWVRWKKQMNPSVLGKNHGFNLIAYFFLKKKVASLNKILLDESIWSLFKLKVDKIILTLSFCCLLIQRGNSILKFSCVCTYFFRFFFLVFVLFYCYIWSRQFLKMYWKSEKNVKGM